MVVSSLSARVPTLKQIPELHSVLMREREVVVLDIETTGLSLDKHAEIIEIGAVKLDVERRKITKTYSQMICPAEAFSIPQKITDITTITWDDVKEKPYIEEVLPGFYAFLGDSPIVAHNAVFDWTRFLQPLFLSVGLYATNEAICTMRLAKYIYPNRGRTGYNLASLCQMFGADIDKEGHHRAHVDAAWTASLFLKLLEEYRNNHIFAHTAEKNNTNLAVNKLPSNIGCENLSKLEINKVSFYKGATTKLGPRIYVYTNFGKIYFDVRRNLWHVQELWSEKNVPAEKWGKSILQKLNMDADSLLKKCMELNTSKSSES